MNTIERKGNEFIIKVPTTANLEALQRLLNYIEYSKLTENTKAEQNQVDELSSQINKSWWEKNKNKFLSE
jgi:hypothetical protein